MLTNAKITIFNQWPDRESRKMVFIPHVIPKVWFHTNQKSTVGENGLRSADEYQIRIPYTECADWITPDAFNRLTAVYGNGLCGMVISLSWENGMEEMSPE